MVRPCLREKLAGAAQRGLQHALGDATVEADIERPWKRAGGPQAGRKPGGVEPTALGDEGSELMPAHGVGPCHMVNAARSIECEFQQSGGQVPDVYRAADVIGEEDTVPSAGRKIMHRAYVYG